MTRRRTLVVLSLCYLSLGLLATSAGTAQEATPTTGSAAVLPPDAEVGGLDLADWSARQWQWWVSIPVDVNPSLHPTAANCGIGPSGPVFFLAGVLTDTSATLPCIVPEGVVLYLGLGGADCSAVEPPPFFGRDEAELKACVEVLVDPLPIAETVLTIDGGSVGDLASYRVATDVFPLTFPENNVFGGPAGVGLAAADGYQVLIGPLPVGEHIIEVSAPRPDGSPLVVRYEIAVAAPTVIEPAASPVAGATPSA